MKEQEEAMKLVDEFYSMETKSKGWNHSAWINYDLAKQCALKCIEEKIKTYKDLCNSVFDVFSYDLEDDITYRNLLKVKQEIEKL